MAFHHSLLLLASASIGLAAAEDAPHFIPATQENTRLADGSPLPENLASIGWKWLTDEGNGGIFKSQPTENPTTTILMMLASGLEPGAVYEVFGYFWADGFDGVDMAQRNVLPAQFGCTLAELQTYDGPTPEADDRVGSWMVIPGFQTGANYGYHAAIEKDHRLDGLEKSLAVEEGTTRLVRARLGLSRADASGGLPVFFAEYPYMKSCIGHSRIDGVAVKRVKHDGPLEMGWKAGTRLHLAIRAGDPVTIQRELDADTNVNAFDEENLTPLFYACGAGDLDLAKKLLDQGADPNLDGQSILPLAAAAISADPALVKLLLDRGAEIPLKLAEDSGKLASAPHPATIHPVIVAIRTGSVPVLSLMLDHATDFDIDELDIDRKQESIFDHVWNAVQAQHWDMVEYLVQKGFPLKHKHGKEMDFMIEAVRAGEVAMPALNAMIGCGVSPVYDARTKMLEYYRRRSLWEIGFSPMRAEDALTAAVDLDMVPLIKRLLPMAVDVTPAYEDAIYARALQIGNREVIDLLRQQFPDAAPARWRPNQIGASRAHVATDGDLRLFLPRTKPLKETVATAHPERRVLAVLSSPEAEGPGSALAAIASGMNGWSVVDRDLVEATIHESGLAKPWQEGEHRMADLGDHLSADIIIIASKFQGEKIGVLAFEVVEVATGLVVHREHFKDNEINFKKDFPALLGRARHALDVAGAHSRHEAVTLLSFTGHGGLPNQIGLARQLNIAVQREVDGTPGMISLTRAQSNRLLEEQALQGNNLIWGASHMVEGSVSRVKMDKIKVVIRLETFGADGSTRRDAEVTGQVHELPELASRAWQILFKGKTSADESDARDLAQAREDALKEATRLLREAEWMIQAAPESDAILPIVETAVALGASLEDTLPLHLDVLFRRIHSLSKRPYSKPNTYNAWSFIHKTCDCLVLPIDVADRLAHDLPKVRALLHQIAFQIEQNGEHILKNENSRKSHPRMMHLSVWNSMQVLLFVRAVLNPDLMEPSQCEEYTLFAQELDDLAQRYFALRRSLELPLNSGHIIRTSAVIIVNKNPGFKEGYLQMFDDAFPNVISVFPYHSSDTTDGQSVRQQIIQRLERIPESKLTDDQRLMVAALRCYMADGRAGRKAVNAAVSLALEMLIAGEFDNLQILPERFDKIDRYSMNHWFGMNGPRHGAGLIPALVHNPRLAPDYRMRWRPYLQMAAVRNAIPNGNEALRKRLSVNNYFSSYERIAKHQQEKRDHDGLQRTLDGAHLFELLGGYRCHVPLQAMAAKTRETKPAALEAKLLLDLREGTSPNPGTLSWPMVDSTKPDVLWMLYFAYASNQKDRYEDAWLIALDCRSGQIIHRINLKQAVVQQLEQALEINYMPRQNSVAIAQTDEHIMFNVSGFATHVLTLAMVFDKASGKAKALPPGVMVGEAVGPSVIGHRGNFYFLDDAGQQPRGIHRGSDHCYKRSLFRINPVTMELRTIVEYGRRPAITPFDDLDRAPRTLSEDEGRLAIYNENTFAYYNPDANTWEIKQDYTSEYFYLLRDKEQRTILNPLNQLQIGGAPSDWRINWSRRIPGQMQIDGPGKLSKWLTVLTDLPEDYRNDAWFEMATMHDEKPAGDAATPFEQHIKKVGGLLPHVVLQTEDHFILALQESNQTYWQTPVRNNRNQPFLFKLSKNELLEFLENQEP